VLLAVAFKFVSAMGADTVTLETLGRVLIVAEDWEFKIGLAFFGLGSLTVRHSVRFDRSRAARPGLVVGRSVRRERVRR